MRDNLPNTDCSRDSDSNREANGRGRLSGLLTTVRSWRFFRDISARHLVRFVTPLFLFAKSAFPNGATVGKYSRADVTDRLSIPPLILGLGKVAQKQRLFLVVA